MKNLSKEMKAICAFMLFGFILIVFGTVRLIFFNVDATAKDDHVDENFNSDKVSEVIEKNANLIDLSTKSIDFVRAKVEKEEYDLSSNGTLYFIPVGSGKCVDFKEVEKSPFADSWDYFYVGVINNNDSYEYFVALRDSSGMGINFQEEYRLYSEQEYLIVDESFLTPLGFKDIYNENKNVKYSTFGVGGYLDINQLEGSSELMIISGRDKIEFLSDCK